MSNPYLDPLVLPPLNSLPKGLQRAYTQNGYLRFNQGTGELYLIPEIPTHKGDKPL